MADNVPNINSIRGLTGAERIKGSIPAQSPSGVSFQELLEQEQGKQTQDIKFSIHAQNRIQERNIVLTTEDRIKLQNGMDRLLEKGGRESLILLNNNAFVVSAQNRTVITAIDSEGLKENVFTNIDSALVI